MRGWLRRGWLLAGMAGVVVLTGWSQPVVGVKGGRVDAQAEELERRLRGDVNPLLAKYCVSCHGGEMVKGEVRLDRMGTLAAALENGQALGVAREMVRTGEMPPKKVRAGVPAPVQPSEHERLILDQWLAAALAYVPPDGAVDPGWFTVHRLNKTEYRNTLRDLLMIDLAKFDPAEKLPADDTGYGFDNIADVLTVSPLAVEAYLDAAERAVAHALGPEVKIAGELGVGAMGFKGGGGNLAGGGVHLHAAGSAEVRVVFPATGEYRVTVVAWEDKGGEDHAKMSVRIDGREVKGEGTKAGGVSVSGTREEPQTFAMKVRVEEGTRVVSCHFTNDYYKPNVADRNLAVESIGVVGPLSETGLARRAGWTAVFGAGKGGKQSEESRAASVLTGFAQRAYRRPLRSGEGEGLMRVYKTRRREGATFEGAVRDGLAAVLVSPSFLFRSVETDGKQAVHRLSGHELASRLAYFIWSSTPDEALLKGAADGSLLTDEGLTAQVVRMVEDVRCIEGGLVEQFTSQWLHLRALETLEIDTGRFPQYTAGLRGDFQREPVLVFGELLRENSPAVWLIDGGPSPFTLMNKRLAEHYGVGGVEGDEFRRVALTGESGRGGVLTMAGVLTATSNTTRTSPVKRGLFVMEAVLGTPPPPPPADIPPLEQAVHAKGEGATLREQLALHVADPTCAACHNRLDPIGLAFEHYDAVGKRRETENGKPIDASGTLPGGERLAGVDDLKRVLRGRGDQFVETLASKMLTFAVGRGMEPFDRPAVRGISERTLREGGGLRTLVESVVLSETFRTCRARVVKPVELPKEDDDE